MRLWHTCMYLDFDMLDGMSLIDHRTAEGVRFKGSNFRRLVVAVVEVALQQYYQHQREPPDTVGTSSCRQFIKSPP